jgi:hypothetical protein
MSNGESTERQDFSGEFKGLRERLMALEKRFNPEKSNLHFGAPRTSMVWPGLWEEIDELACEGLKKVNEHRDYFLEQGMYDDGMYWYELFLLIHGVGVAQSNGQGPTELPTLETQRSILSCLVDISEYSVVIPGDIYSRNCEALTAFLWAFPDLESEADAFRRPPQTRC